MGKGSSSGLTIGSKKVLCCSSVFTNLKPKLCKEGPVSTGFVAEAGTGIFSHTFSNLQHFLISLPQCYRRMEMVLTILVGWILMGKDFQSDRPMSYNHNGGSSVFGGVGGHSGS